jgi:hypothetical protein
MNHRERILAMIVLGIVVVAGLGLMVHTFLLGPLDDRAARKKALLDEIDEMQTRIEQIEAQLPKLNTWQQMSLPADVNLSERQYGEYLSGLTRKARIAQGAMTVIPKRNEARSTIPALGGAARAKPYNTVSFTLRGTATLDQIVVLLEGFYHTSLMHKINRLDIKKPMTVFTATPGQPQRQNTVDVTIDIEALILGKAAKRSTLLPTVDPYLVARDAITAVQGGPYGLALVPWAVGMTGPLGPRRLAPTNRDYVRIGGKNVFFGSVRIQVPTKDNIDVTQFVKLTDITGTVSRSEAKLYNMWTNSDNYRLRTTAGFNAFKIVNDEGDTLVQANVVRIDLRQVIFKVGDKYYALHIGDTIQDAMKRPLKEADLKQLGLVTALTPSTGN